MRDRLSVDGGENKKKSNCVKGEGERQGRGGKKEERVVDFAEGGSKK